MDDADKAQAQQEFMEQHRRRPSPRKHFARFTDKCAECGDPIESERLKAVPTATRCIECENFFIHMQKRYV